MSAKPIERPILWTLDNDFWHSYQYLRCDNEFTDKKYRISVETLGQNNSVLFELSKNSLLSKLSINFSLPDKRWQNFKENGNWSRATTSTTFSKSLVIILCLFWEFTWLMCWKYVSCSFFVACLILGVNFMLRKMANTSSPTVEISSDGDSYEFKTVTALKTSVSKFKLGEEFEEDRLDGKKVKVILEFNIN